MKHFIVIISTFLVMQAQAQQTDYHFSHTDNTTATSDKIWEVWTDVPNWKQWDKGLKEASLEGEFIVGTKGKLIPDKGPKAKFVISEIEPNNSYTFKTKIPFGWLIIKRTLEVKEGETFFTHDVKFTGLLKKILGKKLGKNYREMLPSVMAEIKQLAESK
ncbi:MAG: SRPBCC family protein [Cytophagales bacterium]|nr:SRPBCC family protein [Cytophagales bacterium]